jgi:hypothetical protein
VSTSPNPLRSVLDAIDSGAGSRADIVRATGLRADLVAAAIDHLVRMRRLEARALTSGCPSGGCGSCASGIGDAPGCGAVGPSPARTGPVLVALSVRR